MNSVIERADSAYAYPLLIKQLLATPLANAPEQEIVYRGSYRQTYRQLDERIRRLGSALMALGVKHGDTVAVMEWDSHRYLECYFAIPLIGATLMTANIRLSPEQISYCLDHCGAETLLVHADFLPLLDQIRKQLPKLRRVILLRDDDTALPADFYDEYECLLSTAKQIFEFPDFDENIRATTFYTTGTTGKPKGVQFSHRQIVLHTLATSGALAAAAQGQRFGSSDVYMPLTPMFHVHAWGIPYVATMMGVKQVYPGRYQPDMIVDLIDKESVTFTHCVPTVLQLVLQASNAATTDFSRLKMVVGGAALTAGLCREAQARGIDIFTGYGMSETCPILTLSQLTPEMTDLDPEQDIGIRTKAGRQIPLVHLRVIDVKGQDISRDGVSTGEIVVRAPWLTQAYRGDQEASRILWEGGWLHTQDIGHIDSQGYLQVADRIKDVIKSGGEWVSSLQIEYIVSLHSAIAEVAVIGVPDDKWGERPVPFIVPKPGCRDQVTLESIHSHMQPYADQGVISHYAIPDQIKVVEALEKTSVGKLNKKLMRERFSSYAE